MFSHSCATLVGTMLIEDTLEPLRRRVHLGIPVGIHRGLHALRVGIERAKEHADVLGD